MRFKWSIPQSFKRAEPWKVATIASYAGGKGLYELFTSQDEKVNDDAWDILFNHDIMMAGIGGILLLIWLFSSRFKRKFSPGPNTAERRRRGYTNT